MEGKVEWEVWGKLEKEKGDCGIFRRVKVIIVRGFGECKGVKFV